jgi:hypothetical protein
MIDDDGTLSTFFDRGIFCNILEFLGVNGYSIDYFTLFTLFSREKPRTCVSLFFKDDSYSPTPLDDNDRFNLGKSDFKSDSNSSSIASDRWSASTKKSSSLNSVHARRFSSQSSLDQDNF